MRRVNQIADQIIPDPSHSSRAATKWNGWGFQDTDFFINENGDVQLDGSRYLYSGKVMPSMRPWFEEHLGIDISNLEPAQPFSSIKISPSQIPETFIQAIESHGFIFSQTDRDRLDHSHGNSFQEMYWLRYQSISRLVDVVVWPESHDQVVQLVQLASASGIVLIPFGGGTTVTQSLLCPVEEHRPIVSVDLKKMDKILWIDPRNMQVCIEAGKVGVEIEKELNAKGFCTGHEPDSAEFSTLGGWVATRASGMKKNKYGNIEDLVLSITCVTPEGVIEKSSLGPRQSTGPDVHHFIMGSEGIFGIITRVVLKLSKLPQTREYGSFIFPNFDYGVQFMHSVGLLKCAPASIRLVDNTQFQFGQTLKPESSEWIDGVQDKLKKWVVTELFNYDPKRIAVATIVYEGSKQEVRNQQKAMYKLAREQYGMSAGKENGKRGFFLTYMIAYLRDLGLSFRFLSESFETSVPWSKVTLLCARVKQRIHQSCRLKGFTKPAFASCRVTQVYDTGACVYFYFGVCWEGPEDAFEAFCQVEDEAREEVMACGGSLSHHHGIGKLRKKWIEQVNSKEGVNMLRAIKKSIDPSNVFAAGNIF